MKSNVVFIWIPKTGGTSISSVFEGWMPLLKYKGDVSCFKPYSGWVTFGHQDYRQLVREGLIDISFHRSSYKFAFVRNPYDRFVSLYGHYVNKLQLEGKSLYDFARMLLELREKEELTIGTYNVSGFSQACPQTDWICNEEGEIVIDFVGRFESLQGDFKKLVSRLEAEQTFKSDLPHKNKGTFGNYRYLLNYLTCKVIQDLYRKDFEILGYDI